MSKNIIEGKQCTIVLYVDDRKSFHENQKVIDERINDLKIYFGDITITMANNHSCLGMNIEIIKENKVEIEMKEAI